jgi:hypothetical protein
MDYPINKRARNIIHLGLMYEIDAARHLVPADDMKEIAKGQSICQDMESGASIIPLKGDFSSFVKVYKDSSMHLSVCVYQAFQLFAFFFSRSWGVIKGAGDISAV